MNWLVKLRRILEQVVELVDEILAGQSDTDGRSL